MASKQGAKKTHHCYCGKTGWCRKRMARSEHHGFDYYASGDCSHYIGERNAAARREYEESRRR